MADLNSTAITLLFIIISNVSQKKHRSANPHNLRSSAALHGSSLRDRCGNSTFTQNPDNLFCVNTTDGCAIEITNFPVFVRGPLAKMFPGLNEEKFIEKITKKYKFFVDKTYMNSGGLMLRLPR